MWLRSEKRKNIRALCLNRIRKVRKNKIVIKQKKIEDTAKTDECKENYHNQVVPEYGPDNKVEAPNLEEDLKCLEYFDTNNKTPELVLNSDLPKEIEYSNFNTGLTMACEESLNPTDYTNNMQFHVTDKKPCDKYNFEVFSEKICETMYYDYGALRDDYQDVQFDVNDLNNVNTQEFTNMLDEEMAQGNMPNVYDYTTLYPVSMPDGNYFSNILKISTV